MAKKKIITTQGEANEVSKTNKKKLVSTKSKGIKRGVNESSATRELVFGRENYKWVGIGFALIMLGMLLMIGGFNEDPSQWDESKIYGFQRTLLAPMVILTGLAVEVYAIFK